MTNESARIILLQMLDGLDPTTGEVLPPDHLLNDATVIRALHTAVLALMDVRMPVNRNGRLNAGRAWTEMDRDALAALSRSGASMETMCEKLQRRRRGVQRQLRDMGLPLPPRRGRLPNAPARCGRRRTRNSCESCTTSDVRSRKWHANWSGACGPFTFAWSGWGCTAMRRDTQTGRAGRQKAGECAPLCDRAKSVPCGNRKGILQIRQNAAGSTPGKTKRRKKLSVRCGKPQQWTKIPMLNRPGL